MFEAAIEAPSPHDALIECARAGIPGPVFTWDEGCPGHFHALFTSDEPWEVRDALSAWLSRPNTPLLDVAEHAA